MYYGAITHSSMTGIETIYLTNTETEARSIIKAYKEYLQGDCEEPFEPSEAIAIYCSEDNDYTLTETADGYVLQSERYNNTETYDIQIAATYKNRF